LPGAVSVIAIDGPVAAGKTVVGLTLARNLGFRYLDTGVMYRAITWLALRDATPMDDAEALGALASTNPVTLDGVDSDRVLVGGSSVGPELRDPAVDRHVSLVSRVPEVRRALVDQQRVIASEGRIVMCGRDIGSVVLPGADLKILISASLEERARRRHAELLNRGVDSDLKQVLEETRLRDDLDTKRTDSPLVPACGAWVLTTDNLSIDRVVGLVMERVCQLSQVRRG
jgi:cytidylate kinase